MSFYFGLEFIKLALCRSPTPKRARLGEDERSPEGSARNAYSVDADTSGRPSPTEEVEKMVAEDPLPPPVRDGDDVEAATHTADAAAGNGPSPHAAGAEAKEDQAPGLTP